MSTITVEKTNLLGAIVCVSYFLLCILICIARLAGRPRYGHWIGCTQFLAILPLVFLLIKAPRFERPVLYYVQISLMLVFLLVEILLDYLLKIDFRQIRWAVITYVMLFFAATGGMLGVTALSGRVWTILSVVLFIIMAILAFVQRAVTGM